MLVLRLCAGGFTVICMTRPNEKYENRDPSDISDRLPLRKTYQTHTHSVRVIVVVIVMSNVSQ